MDAPIATRVLSYERPSYTEHRRPPRRFTMILVVVALVLVPLTSLVSFALLHITGARFLLVFPAMSLACVMLIVLTLLFRGVVRVFSDRLETSLMLGSFAFWSIRYPWSQLVRCEACHMIFEGSTFKIWSPLSRLTFFMYGEEGIRLQLENEREVFIGSEDRDKLACAILNAAATFSATGDSSADQAIVQTACGESQQLPAYRKTK